MGTFLKRYWFLLLVLGILVWVIVRYQDQLIQLVETLLLAQVPWLLLALGLQVLYYGFLAATYQASFAVVGIESRLLELVPVTIASIFANMIPSAGAGGLAVFVAYISRSGQSAARAFQGTILVQVADLGAFFPILAGGLTYLFLRHDLTVYEIVASILLFLFVAALVALLLLGLWRPVLLLNVLKWFQTLFTRVASWFKRPWPEDWAVRSSTGLVAASQAIAGRPVALLWPAGMGLAVHLVSLASLWSIFHAFQQPVSPGTLVAGYAMAVLFANIAIVPNGIGVVEGTMVLVFSSLDIPAAKATVVTLAFRGINFWLPLLAGFVLLRRLRRPPRLRK